MTAVDLNCDLGEGFGVWRLGDDAALLDVVTSANVACGFHAGDPSTMRRTVDAAAARGVTVGAQVSYPDLVGFGRRRMDVAPDDLRADVLYQLGALDALCRAAGTRVRYVKPHGALYNRILDDAAQAAAVVDALASYDRSLPLLVVGRSVAADVARAAGVDVVPEVFADRAVTADGRLVPRGQAGAVLTDADDVVRRVLRLVDEHRVLSVDGTDVELDVASVCVHGDTPGAVDLARRLRTGLEDAGVDVRAFRP